MNAAGNAVDWSSRIATRLASLEAAFRHVAATRMAGVPVLHPGLRVQPVGFECEASPALPQAAVLSGVLVTPWFMSVLRLPLQPVSASDGADLGWLAVGHPGPRSIGSLTLDFLGGFEPVLGVYEASSLFSPMFEFFDHGAAVATAVEALALLRAPVAAPTTAPLFVATPVAAPGTNAPVPSRRGFLFGRPSAGAGA